MASDSILLLFLGWLFSKAGKGNAPPPQQQNPVPPNFPGPVPIPIPGVPAPNQPPNPQTQPQQQPQSQPAATYTIKSGDTGVGLAKRGTGDSNRWKEILTANPDLHAVTAPDPTTGTPTTQIVPWNIGQVINVPPGWNLS